MEQPGGDLEGVFGRGGEDGFGDRPLGEQPPPSLPCFGHRSRRGRPRPVTLRLVVSWLAGEGIQRRL
jgi:hypothetical protein